MLLATRLLGVHATLPLVHAGGVIQVSVATQVAAAAHRFRTCGEHWNRAFARQRQRWFLFAQSKTLLVQVRIVSPVLFALFALVVLVALVVGWSKTVSVPSEANLRGNKERA